MLYPVPLLQPAYRVDNVHHWNYMNKLDDNNKK